MSKRPSRIGGATWGPLAILLAVTIIVPAIIFDQFRQADHEQRELLLRSIRHQVQRNRQKQQKVRCTSTRELTV